jgi:SAM-dependent methyltransferase
MSSKDAERWNTRYDSEKRYNSYTSPRPLLVSNAHLLPTGGLAFDAAMGLGGNAQYLIERGLRVVGVDISWVAVRKAKSRLPALMAVLADLTEFHLPEATFDLIINFFYLQRDIWPIYKQALRPGGLLVIETMTQDMAIINPDIDPAYLLTPGELRAAFEDFKILYYQEGWQSSDGKHLRAVASLVARSPNNR